MDLQNALHAKVAGVPVVAVGVPVVILAAVGVRMFGSKTAPADTAVSEGDPGTDAQPTFIAKSVPSNWLALDPTTGTAAGSDGTVYAPVSNSGGSVTTGNLNGIGNIVADPAPISNGGSAVTPTPTTPPVVPPTPITAPPVTTTNSIATINAVKGDNWATLAAKYNVPMRDLINANGGNGSAVGVGQKIKVPVK